MKLFNTICSVALVSVTMLPFTAGAASEEFIFTYDYDGAEIEYFGIQRQVRTDVAMLVKEKGLIGTQIKGVSIDVPYKEGCACEPIGAAWLTSKLAVDGQDYVADITKVEGEIKNYGTEESPELRLDLTFAEPYTLTAEGVYVGYSLTVTACKTVSGWTSKYPVALVNDVIKPECFMIHCNQGNSTLPQKYAQWTDLGEDRHQALSMRVIMVGEQNNNAAGLDPEHTLYAIPGGHGPVYTTLVNYGTEPVSSIEYTYTLKGDDAPRTITKELTLDTPLEGKAGAQMTLDIDFEAPEELGSYAIPLMITKVNGEPNAADVAGALEIEVVPFVPVNNPLVEDYTGFWCGNCPEVYVLCHQLLDKYGHDFLSISYHVQDQLQTVPTGDMPSSTYGIPAVYMGNRSSRIDFNNLEYLWQRARRTLAPAEISAELYWADADKSAIRAESTVKFVYDNPDANYRVAYALIEDSMSDPKWRQRNYYSTDSSKNGPYWDLFAGKEYSVAGIVYDDVVVNFPKTTGIEGSVPAQIEGGVEYKYNSILSLDDARCQYDVGSAFGKYIILDPDKLRVVALLIDADTGNVCNAVSTGYSGDAKIYDPTNTGVECIAGIEGDVTGDAEYYSIDGRRLSGAPAKGIYIELVRLADGTTRAIKKSMQ